MQWERPTHDPRLAPGEIHLWRIPLRREPALVEERAHLLSEDERDRMLRFRFDLHRERFALRRGALRIILGRYMRAEPAGIVFHYSPRGKPEVARLPGSRVLRFNLSDASDVALLGVTMDHRIGVDIEELRPLPDVDLLVHRFFSREECDEYERIAPSGRLAAFYDGWTRKEAWLKARGDGLAAPLDRFDVTMAPGLEPRLLRVQDEPDEAMRWSLSACSPFPGYVAAIAVERLRSRLVPMTL